MCDLNPRRRKDANENMHTHEIGPSYIFKLLEAKDKEKITRHLEEKDTLPPEEGRQYLKQTSHERSHVTGRQSNGIFKC